MKYIRTKDKVFETKEVKIQFRSTDYYYVKGEHRPIGSDEIIKQSDTIEELCDEFVSKDFERIITKEQLFEYRRTNVMGAIWTDKGLIYVAKMNEKGELELL